jgi:hypothetical protein
LKIVLKSGWVSIPNGYGMAGHSRNLCDAHAHSTGSCHANADIGRKTHKQGKGSNITEGVGHGMYFFVFFELCKQHLHP